MKTLLTSVIIFSAFAGCTDTSKEDNLRLREQALVAREKLFETKEAEYKSLLSLRDSLQNFLKAVPAQTGLPEEILGSWSGKMICTESSCADHVIGDQRNDIWEFSSTGLKMTNKTGGERLFSGSVAGTDLKLISVEDSNITNRSEITLSIADLHTGRIKGSRDFIGKDGCIAKFSVELEKAKK